MAFTVANASIVMTEKIEPVLRNAFLIGTDLEAPTFDLFMKGEKERTNELGRRVPIMVVPNASYGAITEGGQLPLAGTPAIVQLRIYYLNQFMMGEINRSVLDQETESDLIKFARFPMEADQKKFRHWQNLWMHGTGNGALGVAGTVVTGASGTVTFVGAYGGIKSTTIDAGAATGTGGTALTPGMLDLMAARRRRMSGANVSKEGRTYISHSTQEFNYRQLGYTSTYGIQRIIGMNQGKFDLGIGVASHNGQAWIVDNQAPKSVIWDLYLPDWTVEYVKLPSFYDDGNGNKMWMKSGSGAPYDALQYGVYARYDLLCKNRSNQSAILNLPYVSGF